MPNWCNNTVEISHPDTARMHELVGAINEGKFCNFAIPVPASLHIVAGSVGDPEEQKQLEEATELNRVVHGYGNWYDFCVARWGTKWDVEPYDAVDYDDAHDDNRITFGFDSAWAPPTGVYEALVEQGYSVKAYYYEPGMAFCGKWEDGEDDYLEFSGMTADEVEKLIDPELDEVMCITENMREWEEEENEYIDLDGGLSAINEQEQHENK